MSCERSDLAGQEQQPSGLAASRDRRWPSGFSLLRLLGLGLFFILIWRTDRRALGEHLRSVHWEWFAPALLLQAALLLAKSLRWHLLTTGTPAGTNFVRCLGQYLESYAVGVVTPGRVGEFLRVGHAVRAGGPALDAGLLVICERSLDFGMFLLAAGLALSLKCLPYFNPILAALVVAGGIGVVFGASAVFTSQRAINLLVKVTSVTPLYRFRVFGTYAPRRQWAALIVVFLSGTSAFCHFLSCHCLAFSVGLDSTFIQTAGGLAVAGLLTALPITIMGMGTREVALLYVYQTQSQSLVLAFSALVLLAAQIGGGTLAMLAGQAALWLSRPQNQSVN